MEARKRKALTVVEKGVANELVLLGGGFPLWVVRETLRRMS